ncbi:MAG: hypothetical protein ACRD2P_15005, partial [Terriglobia bacterium]
GLKSKIQGFPASVHSRFGVFGAVAFVFQTLRLFPVGSRDFLKRRPLAAATNKIARHQSPFEAAVMYNLRHCFGWRF